MQEQLLRKFKVEKKWTGVFLYVLVLILVLLNIFLNLFSLCHVIGESMMPTIKDSQYVVLTRTFRAERGEIVIVSVDGLDYPIIKRIVACPGDTFALVTDATKPAYLRKVYLYLLSGGSFRLYDDGLAAMDYYKFEVFRTIKTGDINALDSPADTIDAEGLITFRVPANSYFVLGDNRNNSSDSREYGFIHKKNIHASMAFKLNKDSFLERIFIFFYGKDSAN